MSVGDQYSCEFGSATYYAYCGFGGILSCGLTHTAVVPLDLVKCRIQVNKSCFLKYACTLYVMKKPNRVLQCDKNMTCI